MMTIDYIKGVRDAGNRVLAYRDLIRKENNVTNEQKAVLLVACLEIYSHILQLINDQPEDNVQQSL